MEERIRLGIVISEFNYDVTYLMLQRALNHAKFLGAEVRYVVKVPGASRMQALERVDDYARRAVEAAVKMIRRLKLLSSTMSTGETLFIE